MLLSALFQNPIYLVIFIAFFVFALTIHELAHAWIAYRSGDPTAKYMGRLTLNPLAHLDPLGTLFFLIAGFGWAKPVPINPNNFHRREDEIKVSLAGITANIVAAFILAIPIRYALFQGQTIDSSLTLTILNFAVEINLILAAFNLLPIFPLDGSHLVSYFLSPRARETFESAGMPILFGLLILGRFSNFSIIAVAMEPVLRFLSFLVRGTFISG
ncbi:MAG: site-2 protease family protein [Patescibacteria group bacterium]